MVTVIKWGGAGRQAVGCGYRRWEGWGCGHMDGERRGREGEGRGEAWNQLSEGAVDGVASLHLFRFQQISRPCLLHRPIHIHVINCTAHSLTTTIKTRSISHKDRRCLKHPSNQRQVQLATSFNSPGGGGGTDGSAAVRVKGGRLELEREREGEVGRERPTD